MNTTSAMVLTGAIVTAGKWSANEKLSTGTIVGASFAAIGLAGLAEASQDLASKFALLIVVVTLFRYAPAIFYKFGLITQPVYDSAKGWGSA